MNPIIISVIVPTYKRPLLLARCLSAVSKQSLAHDSFEIIVVSDGPDEISLDVAKQLLEGVSNYKFLMLPEKKGPAAARNVGWQQSTGQLIAFTDDDCLPDENWLNEMLNQYHGEKYKAFTGKVVVPMPDRPTDFARNTAHLETAEFVTANCCITREALLLTGGFDERFLLAWREDSDLEFKLLDNNIPVQRVATAVVTHPVREASWGVSIKEQRKGIFNALLYKKFPSLYRARIQPSPQWDYYIIIISCIVFITGLLTRNALIMIPSLLLWLILSGRFVYRRLQGTSHAPEHVAEMIITSLAIPFLSVYWQLYGAIKYRVLFL